MVVGGENPGENVWVGRAAKIDAADVVAVCASKKEYKADCN